VNPRTDHSATDQAVTKEPSNVTLRHPSGFFNSKSSLRARRTKQIEYARTEDTEMRRVGRALSAAVSLVAILGVATSLATTPAAAETPAPGYQVFGRISPTVLHPGHFGSLTLNVYDTGGAESTEPLTITDDLPEGLEVMAEVPEFKLPTGEEVEVPELTVELSSACSHAKVAGRELVTCTLTAPPIDGSYTTLEIPFKVDADAGELNPGPSTPDLIEWSGGGAAEGGRSSVGVHFGPFGTTLPPGFAKVDGWLTTAEGSPDTQAGSHPYGFTFAFSTVSRGLGSSHEIPVGELHTLRVELPPGLIGSATATPTCPRAVFEGVSSESCPADTQVGLEEVALGGNTAQTFPIYNLAPPKGDAAQFAFTFGGGIDTFVDSHVRTGSDDAIYQEVVPLPQRGIVFSSTTIFGDPAELNGGGGAPRPLLTTPTACGGPLSVSAEGLGTWQEPETDYAPEAFRLHNSLEEPVGFSGCERLQFEPSIEGRPTTDVADSPTGFDFDLHVPQDEAPEGLATSELKEATVTLPEGLVVDPSSANGLQACSEAQIGYKAGTSGPYEFTPAASTCPEASKLGTVEVDTPLIGHPLPGSVYLASQQQNPFGSLLALYIVVDDPITGLIIKLPALVSADPTTGRLTATVGESPQQPFTDFHFDFFEGAHASLQTPESCGRYETTTALTPWSGGATAHPGDPFEVSVAAGGNGACPTSESGAPNHPASSAGTLSTTAGAFSPFVFRVAREDGSQRLSRIDTTLPEGLLAKLAGISYCPASAIAQAEHRSAPGEGATEQAHPSCPVSSEVGSVDVGAGAGPTPVYVSGKAYLAGPYKGAPLSLEIITPAIAGPFDLGTVAVRTALQVDPLTARVTAVSDPLPQVVQGIPLDIRSVAVKLDRPDFTLNPTSCDPMRVTGALTALTGQSAALSDPFQVGECSRLGFKPALKISLSGQTHRAGHPGLKAVLTYPSTGSWANIARVQVNLPHSEFVDQANFNKTCTRPVLLEGKCPATSIYGHLEAWSPLLEAPLEGPVYVVGGFGYKLPALVAELNGQIRFLLVGKIDSGKNHGIRATFEAVPDAPVSRVVLQMKGGRKYSLLENSEDLCRKPQRAIADFTAQNGKTLDFRPTIANSCGKGKKGKAARKGHKKGSKSKG
jgi:hypothetical protein